MSPALDKSSLPGHFDNTRSRSISHAVQLLRSILSQLTWGQPDPEDTTKMPTAVPSTRNSQSEMKHSPFVKSRNADYSVQSTSSKFQFSFGRCAKAFGAQVGIQVKHPVVVRLGTNISCQIVPHCFLYSPRSISWLQQVKLYKETARFKRLAALEAQEQGLAIPSRFKPALHSKPERHDCC